LGETEEHSYEKKRGGGSLTGVTHYIVKGGCNSLKEGSEGKEGRVIDQVFSWGGKVF